MQIGQPLMFAASMIIPTGYIQIPTDWLYADKYPELYETVKQRDYVEVEGTKFKINDFNFSQPLPGGGEIVSSTAGLKNDGVLVIMRAVKEA